MSLSGSLGRTSIDVTPDVPIRLNDEHKREAWENFLAGVYGIDTADGHPETLSLKQFGVLSIKNLKAFGLENMSAERSAPLQRAVAFLDSVESSFAPLEAA